MSSRFGERFLRSPELFPARRAGEAWGRNAVAVDFGGGPYVFTGLSAEQEAAARERFAGFCRQGAVPREGIECRVLRVSPEEFRSFDLRGFELTLDLDAQADAVRVAGLGLMARLEWRPVARRRAVDRLVRRRRVPGRLENVLRVAGRVSRRRMRAGRSSTAPASSTGAPPGSSSGGREPGRARSRG